MSNIPPYIPVAKALIFDNEGKILFLHKAREYTVGNPLGSWDFPGGCLEPGEDLLTGLKRELFEETALEVDVVTSICAYDLVQQNRHLIIVKYACINPRGTIKISPEHENYFWLSPEEIKSSFIPKSMKNEVARATILLD